MVSNIEEKGLTKSPASQNLAKQTVEKVNKYYIIFK